MKIQPLVQEAITLASIPGKYESSPTAAYIHLSELEPYEMFELGDLYILPEGVVIDLDLYGRYVYMIEDDYGFTWTTSFKTLEDALVHISKSEGDVEALVHMMKKEYGDSISQARAK